jgi:hypothetical protein
MAERQTTRADDSSYDAKYPYNRVIETWAGHQIQFDDTPGSERIFIRHASGTYQEISADGKMVTYAVGDTKTYNKAGVTLTVDENGDVKMSGHQRLLVGGGSHIEVAGDAGVFVGGNAGIAGMGAINLRAKTAYVGTDGDMNMNVGGNMTMETKGTHTIKAAKVDINP